MELLREDAEYSFSHIRIALTTVKKWLMRKLISDVLLFSLPLAEIRSCSGAGSDCHNRSNQFQYLFHSLHSDHAKQLLII